MTSNERKIINFLRDIKEKAHIRLIAQKTNFSNSYTQSLCHSLARAGYIKLEDANVCHLLKKGLGHFESVAVMREVSEPVASTANVNLLTDEPAGTPYASDRDDKADDDAQLDRALADLEPSSQKDESEAEKGKPEEPKDETENESGELEEEKIEEVAEESNEEINTDKKEDAINEGIFAETEATEEEKETASEIEMKTATNMADGNEEIKAENPEKVALKEESVNPGGGFSASFKKIINWFAQKK